MYAFEYFDNTKRTWTIIDMCVIFVLTMSGMLCVSNWSSMFLYFLYDRNTRIKYNTTTYKCFAGGHFWFTEAVITNASNWRSQKIRPFSRRCMPVSVNHLKKIKNQNPWTSLSSPSTCRHRSSPLTRRTARLEVVEDAAARSAAPRSCRTTASLRRCA